MSWEAQFETKYLSLREDAGLKDRKTKFVYVLSATHPGVTLGEIRWYGNWRQYALYPRPNTIWNPDCLETVNKVIRYLMDERKHQDA